MSGALSKPPTLFVAAAAVLLLGTAAVFTGSAAFTHRAADQAPVDQGHTAGQANTALQPRPRSSIVDPLDLKVVRGEIEARRRVGTVRTSGNPAVQTAATDSNPDGSNPGGLATGHAAGEGLSDPARPDQAVDRLAADVTQDPLDLHRPAKRPGDVDVVGVEASVERFGEDAQSLQRVARNLLGCETMPGADPAGHRRVAPMVLPAAAAPLPTERVLQAL